MVIRRTEGEHTLLVDEHRHCTRKPQRAWRLSLAHAERDGLGDGSACVHEVEHVPACNRGGHQHAMREAISMQ